jgi:hypothetical protein
MTVITNAHIESSHAKAAPVAWAMTCPGSFRGVRRLGNAPALAGRRAR